MVPLLAAAVAAQRPVPSHAPAPATPATRGGAVVARVNGAPITNDRLDQALASLIPQESFHRNVSADRMAALRAQALSSLIDEELVYEDGVRRGLTASDADLRLSWEATVRSNGGPAAFQATMRKNGLTEASVRKELARRLIVGETLDAAVNNNCGVSRDDAGIYFREHRERFVEPEQVHVYGITVGVDPASAAPVWQAAKARAQQARAALDAGRPFADVAKEFSTDPSKDKGGDLGLVHRGGMTAPFEDIVKTLPVGTPSDVVESIYGYHIVLVTDVRPAGQKTFDEVVDSIVKDLSATRCEERRTAWLAGLRAAARIEMLPAAEPRR
jgi:peptidyl-prolyl cis-trans isomerase C